MSDFGPLVGWRVVIAASVVAGAVTVAVLRLRARVAAVVTSFGGGILLAAVAFELVPDADVHTLTRDRGAFVSRSAIGRVKPWTRPVGTVGYSRSWPSA